MSHSAVTCTWPVNQSINLNWHMQTLCETKCRVSCCYIILHWQNKEFFIGIWSPSSSIWRLLNSGMCFAHSTSRRSCGFMDSNMSPTQAAFWVLMRWLLGETRAGNWEQQSIMWVHNGLRWYCKVGMNLWEGVSVYAWREINGGMRKVIMLLGVWVLWHSESCEG